MTIIFFVITLQHLLFSCCIFLCWVLVLTTLINNPFMLKKNQLQYVRIVKN